MWAQGHSLSLALSLSSVVSSLQWYSMTSWQITISPLIFTPMVISELQTPRSPLLGPQRGTLGFVSLAAHPVTCLPHPAAPSRQKAAQRNWEIELFFPSPWRWSYREEMRSLVPAGGLRSSGWWWELQRLASYATSSMAGNNTDGWYWMYRMILFC